MVVQRWIPAALPPALVQVGHLPVGVLIGHQVRAGQQAGPPHLLHVHRVPAINQSIDQYSPQPLFQINNRQSTYWPNQSTYS